MKTCRICQQAKDISEFYEQPRNIGGYHHDCKICVAIYRKKWFQTKRGKSSRKRYQQSEKGKTAIKRYHIRHPEVRPARTAVSRAIKKGILPKPQLLKCYYCSNQAKEYHHPSYVPEDRLKVVPTCVECHK